MTINESLTQIKSFQDKVSDLKTLINIQSVIIDKTNDIKVVKEFYTELLKRCSELDKFTQK